MPTPPKCAAFYVRLTLAPSASRGVHGGGNHEPRGNTNSSLAANCSTGRGNATKQNDKSLGPGWWLKMDVDSFDPGGEWVGRRESSRGTWFPYSASSSD